MKRADTARKSRRDAKPKTAPKSLKKNKNHFTPISKHPSALSLYLSGKIITVLAGTGPVGKVAARLCAMEGANVIVTSRKLERATAVATKVNEEIRAGKAWGKKAAAPDEIGESIKDADIILSAGAAGIQLLPLNVLKVVMF